MRRRTFLALSPVTALLGAASARPARVRQAAGGDPRFDGIAGLVREKMAEYGVTGVGLGILVDGTATLRGFGITSLDDPQPVTEHTRFTIASISKTMTATAVMRLVETGRVDLRAPVRQYVPDFRVLDDETTRTVSLWHCLTHTPGWEGQLATDDRGAQALAHFAGTIMPALPQLAPPGRVWGYNNAGFALAGRVIEQVAGQGIHEALRDLVFDPLGLRETTTRLTEAMTHPITLGHRERDGRAEVIRPFQTTSSTTAGGVLTSLGDIMRYARFHLGDGTTPDGVRYIAPALVELMRTPQVAKHGTTDRMSVGWHARTVGGVETFAHGGTLNGHCLLLQFVPSRNLAFAILSTHVNGWRLLQDVEAAILWQYAGVALARGQLIGHRGVNEAMTFHAAALQAQPGLDEYVGEYHRPPVGSVTVRRDGNRLTVATGASQAAAPITFYGPDAAYALSGQYTGMPYEFVRDDAGAVRWIRVNGRIARRA